MTDEAFVEAACVRTALETLHEDLGWVAYCTTGFDPITIGLGVLLTDVDPTVVAKEAQVLRAQGASPASGPKRVKRMFDGFECVVWTRSSKLADLWKRREDALDREEVLFKQWHTQTQALQEEAQKLASAALETLLAQPDGAWIPVAPLADGVFVHGLIKARK